MSFIPNSESIETHGTIQVRGVRRVTIEDLGVPMAPFQAVFNPRHLIPGNNLNYEAKVRVCRVRTDNDRLNRVYGDIITRASL
jgi:hypothetical protein